MRMGVLIRVGLLYMYLQYIKCFVLYLSLLIYLLFYHVPLNRSTVHKCKGLGARLKKFNNKSMLSCTYNTVVYTLAYMITGTTYGPLFTRKCLFVHVWQPNGPEYRLNVTVSWWSFDVSSGTDLVWICRLTYLVCLLLEGLAHSFGIAPLY